MDKIVLFLDDIFGLDEISIYEGDWNENIYAVSGEVLDSVSSHTSHKESYNT